MSGALSVIARSLAIGCNIIASVWEFVLHRSVKYPMFTWKAGFLHTCTYKVLVVKPIQLIDMTASGFLSYKSSLALILAGAINLQLNFNVCVPELDLMHDTDS